MAEEEPTLDLGEGVVLETPAPDPNHIFNANDIVRKKQKGWPKGKKRSGVSEQQIAPKQALNKPLAGETLEHSLIRRLVDCAKAHTQLAAIIPDQCTGCVDRHRMGIKRMPTCTCACHEARAYLREHPVGA